MSYWGTWGYFGIVVGLLALVAMLFVCLDLLYRASPEAVGGERTETQPAGGKPVGSRTGQAA